MKRHHIFLFAFFIAATVRFVLNFSVPQVPGTGGGYTIIQIRAILENGHLAVPDMPLVFYFNALIVRLLSIVLPNADTNLLIINVVKVFDSLVFPLMLFPMYKISSLVFRSGYSKFFLTAVSLFAVLTYSPLELASDAVKNSVGLMFMTFVIYHFLSYLEYKKTKDLIFTLLFLVLTSLSHFGSFMVSLAFLLSGLIVVYRKKALFYIVGIAVAGVFLVAVFDPHRALSMVSFWKKAFTLFINPRILYYPYGIFNYVSSFLLIFFIIKLLRRKKERLTVNKRNVLLIFLIVLTILSFPFYGFEYGRRLGLFLFLPQSVVLLVLYPEFRHRLRTVISIFLIILVAFLVTVHVLHPKPMAITNEAYTDMKKIGHEIRDPERTLVFCRHGLEWWVAWEHHVRIAMPHVEVDDGMKEKYDQIFYLVQKKGANQHYPGKRDPHVEPLPPGNSIKVYDSEYFIMYRLMKEEQPPEIQPGKIIQSGSDSKN